MAWMFYSYSHAECHCCGCFSARTARIRKSSTSSTTILYISNSVPGIYRSILMRSSMTYECMYVVFKQAKALWAAAAPTQKSFWFLSSLDSSASHANSGQTLTISIFTAPRTTDYYWPLIEPTQNKENFKPAAKLSQVYVLLPFLRNKLFFIPQ